MISPAFLENKTALSVLLEQQLMQAMYQMTCKLDRLARLLPLTFISLSVSVVPFSIWQE